MDATTEAAEAPTAAQPPAFLIGAAFAARINLADYQNAVSVLRELSVTNHTEAAVPGLVLSLKSVPPLLTPRTWRLDALGAKQQYRVTDLGIALDGAALARLTEAEPARVALVLRRADAADVEPLARWEQPIELLPRHHRAGLSATQDMVAAFVQPNEPAIDRLLKQVADVLRAHGKPRALNGYAGGTKRAWELASALWAAVAAWGVDYALPPASFEVAGQKIRSVAHSADGGVATCMDLALLFCSALEQIGLHPLLVFTKGHAFAGVWLKCPLRPSPNTRTAVLRITAVLLKPVARRPAAMTMRGLLPVLSRGAPLATHWASHFGQDFALQNPPRIAPEFDLALQGVPTPADHERCSLRASTRATLARPRDFAESPQPSRDGAARMANAEKEKI